MKHTMDELGQDLRFAIRQLRRQPGFGLIVVMTLALGIGLNTAVFSLLNTLFFRPLPGVEDPETLVAVYTDEGGGPGVSSYMDFIDFREEVDAFTGLAAFRARPVDLATEAQTERIEGLLVTHGYFAVLGVHPAAGRFFLPDEDEVPGRDAVAVLSHAAWKTRFGADQEVIGRTLTLNGRAFTVVGVAPAGFRGTNLVSAPHVFVPMAMQPHLMPSSGLLLDRRSWGGINVIGRLRSGATANRAEAELGVVGSRLAQEYASTNRNRTYSVGSFRDATMPPGVRRSLLGFGGMLIGLSLLVLLIACVNVANLMLARAARRRREIAVRRTLGAGSVRVVRQLLTESTLLAVVGGALAVMLATWATDLFRALPQPFQLDFGLDRRVLVFAAAISLLTGLGFGLAPALQLAGRALTSGLKGEEARARGRRPIRATDALVVVQVALSVAVLAGAGLFTRTLINLRLQDPGFDSAGVLTATLDPSLQGYDGDRIKGFYRDVLANLLESPGVRTATVSSRLPGPDQDRFGITLQGFEPAPDQGLSIQVSMVGTDYFGTLGIPIRRGRAFGLQDREGAPPVVVINESAERFIEGLTGRDALDVRISVEGPDGPFIDVIGIAADARMGTQRQGPVPHMYIPWELVPGAQTFPQMAVLALVEGRPESFSAGLRSAVARVDANVPVMSIRSLDAHLGDTIVGERLAVSVLAVGGALALLLASLGLYGVLSNAVSRRTAEIGIRMALGAERTHVLRRVLARGIGLTAAGIVLGLGAAAAGSGALSAFLYGVSARDLSTFASTAFVLGLVALVASWVPARRATRVDPVIALRHE